MYCVSSCNTQACELRKAAKKAAQARLEATSDATENTAVALSAPASTAQSLTSIAPASAPVTGVTLSPNLTNFAMLALAPKAPELLKNVFKFIGELFTPPPAVGPSTWLPPALRQVQAPLVLVDNTEWEEPRLFVYFEYEAQIFLYRARHELLFVQQPNGTLQQVCTFEDFTALTSPTPLTIAQIVNQYVPGFVAAEQASEQAPLDALLTPEPLLLAKPLDGSI
jgi:hypothetical protein